MSKLTQRMTELTLVPDGEPLFSEKAIVIKIVDEAAGEHLTIGIPGSDDPLRIDADEWPDLRDAIDRMVKGCRR